MDDKNAAGLPELTAAGLFNYPRRRRIMVVDEDPDTMRMLGSILNNGGFESVIVANEKAALDLLGKIEPDLVILDSSMTEDCFITIGQLRKQSDVPIIMVSRYHDLASLKKAFASGADDVVNLPLGPRSFIARIHAKLRRTPGRVTGDSF